MHLKPLLPRRGGLHTIARGHIGKTLKGFYEIRPTIWIARIIQSIGAERNVARAHGFGETQRHGKENSVARWNIGHWNIRARKVTVFWDRNVRSECAATKRAQINCDLAVINGA